jgi:hypothetical protein
MANHFQEIDRGSADELWAQLSPKLPTAQTNLVFRGQADSTWRLAPSVLRHDADNEDKTFFDSFFKKRHLTTELQIFLEARLIQRFIDQCDRAGLPIPNDSLARRQRMFNGENANIDRFQKCPALWPDNDWVDLLAIAQHHDLPTRLLDWSFNPFVAVYFAASAALKRRKKWVPETRLAVWALNVVGIDELTTRPPGPVPPGQFHDPQITPYRHPSLIPDLRVITVPGAISVHLSAQSGLFTLQKETAGPKDPVAERALEDDPICQNHLTRYTLPATRASEVLRLCEIHQVTAVMVYRSYDGAARSVVDSTRIWSENELFGPNAPG